MPDQPIFYPVLDEQYAIRIARDWNTRDGGTGYVLRFAVDGEYLSRYPVQTVGSRMHREYWIPAEELAQFNEHIVPPIEVIGAFKASGDDERQGNQGPQSSASPANREERDS
ncbi:MAG TPA: hypothetical protein VME18_13950 [Acidobacteriaceae bacterium]|nr:hypothetical protein [Acidobacteriaceae bacterium]